MTHFRFSLQNGVTAALPTKPTADYDHLFKKYYQAAALYILSKNSSRKPYTQLPVRRIRWAANYDDICLLLLLLHSNHFGFSSKYMPGSRQFTYVIDHCVLRRAYFY